MATRKVTITLDESQLDRVRALVDSGAAPSVSGYVQHAVAVALDDETEWGVLLAEALEESGGPMTPEERAWAEAAIGVSAPRIGQ